MSTGTPEPGPDDDRDDLRRSYIALAFVAIVVAAGVWLLHSFQAKNRTIECIEAGRHDCVPLDTAVRGVAR